MKAFTPFSSVLSVTAWEEVSAVSRCSPVSSCRLVRDEFFTGCLLPPGTTSARQKPQTLRWKGLSALRSLVCSVWVPRCVVRLIWSHSCVGNKHSFLSSYTLWSVMGLLRGPGVSTPSLSGACNSCKSGVTHTLCVPKSLFHTGCEVDTVTSRNGKCCFEVWNVHFRCVYGTMIQVHFRGWKTEHFVGAKRCLQALGDQRRSGAVQTLAMDVTEYWVWMMCTEDSVS